MEYFFEVFRTDGGIFKAGSVEICQSRHAANNDLWLRVCNGMAEPANEITEIISATCEQPWAVGSQQAQCGGGLSANTATLGCRACQYPTDCVLELATRVERIWPFDDT